MANYLKWDFYSENKRTADAADANAGLYTPGDRGKDKIKTVGGVSTNLSNSNRKLTGVQAPVGSGANMIPNSFGNFAQTMNNNAAIGNSMTINRVGATGAATPEIFFKESSAQSGTVVDGSESGEKTVDTSTGSETGGTETEGVTMGNDNPPATSTVGGESTGVGTVTGSGTVIGGDTESGTVIGSETGQTYEEWMATNGYDPDKDYDDAKAALEYDYMTSMATYGQRAEELYQMGLSGSGVSDIYQLGAFNAYIQSQNDLANQKIEMKKKYKQEYDAFVKGKQDEINRAYGLGYQIYDGTNAEYVRTQLLASEVSEEAANAAIEKLRGVDVNTLPAVLAKNEADAATRQNNINSAFTSWVQNGYMTDMEDRVRTLYGKDGLGWSDEDINTLIGKLNATAVVTQPDKDAIINDGAAKLAAITDENGNVIYDGSDSSKTVLSQLMDNAEYADYAPYIDEIFAKIDENRGELASSMVDTDINKETGTVTTDELGESLGAVEDAYGKDSPAYIEEQGKVSQKTLETLNWALEANEDGTPKRLGNSEVGELLGFDPEDWESKDAAEQEDEIMAYAGELRQSGQLTAADYNRFIDKIVGNEIKDIIKTDKGDAKATGLTSAGLVVSKLLSYKDNGYLTDDEYNYYVRKVINRMGFKMNSRGQINWYSTVEGAEGTVALRAFSIISSIPEGEDKENIKQIYHDQHNQGTLIRKDDTNAWVVYNGQLYEVNHNPNLGNNNVYNIYKISADQLDFYGDGVWKTDEMRQGFYEIFVAMLSPIDVKSPLTPNDSVSYSTSGRPGGNISPFLTQTNK